MTSQPSAGSTELNLEEPGAVSGEGLPKMLWRHKFLLLLCLAGGLGLGYWRHQRKPTTYSAATQLMIRSENPLSLDSGGGGVVGGIPDLQVLSTLIRSDRIISEAVADPELQAIAGGGTNGLAGRLRGGLQFSAPQSRGPTDRAIVTLSCDGLEPEFCVAAVNATSRAMEKSFEKERSGSIDRFSSLISKAQENLLPEIKKLEEDYKAFREQAPLDWAADGSVVNPHRQRQELLRARQLEADLERRRLKSDLRLVESVRGRDGDLSLVAQIINQLRDDANPDGENSLELPEDEAASAAAERMAEIDARMKDVELESLEVEQSLVPLLVEQQRLVSLFGPSHPSVESLTQQVDITREKLNELAAKRQDRVKAMRQEAEDLLEARRTLLEQDTERARQVYERHQKELGREIEAYVSTMGQRIAVLDEQIDEMKTEIGREKALADELSQAESNDAMFRRQIETFRGMMFQLEDKMAGLSVTEVNHGVVVEPLTAAFGARITGPDLKRDLLTTSMIGLGIGGLLSLLIESTSRMFHSSEQVEAELGLPVIAHVPVDERAASRIKSGDDSPNGIAWHSNLSTIYRPESPTSEAIRCTRTALLFDAAKHHRKVYQITSPLPGDGKSMVAANLAVTLARSGKRVLLIDLDLRSPRLSGRFGLEDKPGLTNLLNGELDPRSAAIPTGIDDLDVLPSGTIPENPAEALLMPELGEALDWYRDHYDFIIVDTPPVLLVTDPAITTAYTDATLLAIRIVRRSRANAKEAVSILRGADAQIAGVIVNKVGDVGAGSHYQAGNQGSYQSVGYGYGSRYRKERLKAGGDEGYKVVGDRKRRAAAEASRSTPSNGYAPAGSEIEGQSDQSSVALLERPVDQVDQDDASDHDSYHAQN